jgi:spermidine synthase
VNEEALSNFSFREMFGGRRASLVLDVTRWVYSSKSAFQKIDIFDTIAHGRILALDGIVQTMERWEFMYHEMMAHVPLMLVNNPQKVLVIGGGDGGTIREVLKHRSVKSIALCEIDREVVEVSRSFLPGLGDSFSDSRVSCFFEDGSLFIKNATEKWDAILIDSTDPTAGEGGQLFTEDFYRICRDHLTEGGVLVAQTENPIYDAQWMKTAFRRIHSAFPKAAMYLGFSPQYPSGFWTYSLGYNERPKSVETPFWELIHDKRKEIPDGLRYYSEKVHNAAFCLPPFMEQFLFE